MKNQQGLITASVILSIVYTSTLFGPDPVLPDIPEDIYDLVDEFCGGENKNREKELNDRYYEKTGYLKPYSNLHSWLACLTIEQSEHKSSINILEFTIFSTSLCTAYYIQLLTLPKIFPALLNKTLLPRFLAVIPSTIIALSADYIVAKIAERLSHSHLTIKYPTKVAILNDNIVISNWPSTTKETRSLSDMQLKDKTTCLIPLFHKHRNADYTIEKGRINIYCSDHGTKDKTWTLSTPGNLTSLNVSEDASTIVALDKKGSLHKLELQNRPSLYEIMNSD